MNITKTNIASAKCEAHCKDDTQLFRLFKQKKSMKILRRKVSRIRIQMEWKAIWKEAQLMNQNMQVIFLGITNQKSAYSHRDTLEKQNL